jgi:hypothetical protein
MNQSLLFACALMTSMGAMADTKLWPDWVMDPQSVAALAASDCIPYSGSLSIDRQQVAANARLALAQQIGVRIEAMDKTYLSRVSDGKAPKLNSSFESSSQQTVDTALKGSRLQRVEIWKNTDGSFLCGLIVLEPDTDKKIVQSVIQSKSVAMDTETEEILLAKFRERSASKGAQ